MRQTPPKGGGGQAAPPNWREGKSHPILGKWRQHQWKEGRNTQNHLKKEAPQHRPTEDKGKVAPPRTPPTEGAGKAAPPCWNVDLTRTPKSMLRYSHTCSLKCWNCAKEKVSSLQTSTDVRLLDVTRRRAFCRAAWQAFLHGSTTTTNCHICNYLRN